MKNNHLLKMMKLRLLVQGLQSIDFFHQLADKCNFYKQVINMQIEIYLMHLIYFFSFNSVLSVLLIFIENQSHRSSEIKPECNRHFHETSSPTNHYCVQQDTSYYQSVSYNQFQ